MLQISTSEHKVMDHIKIVTNRVPLRPETAEQARYIQRLRPFRVVLIGRGK